jgi:hypothetical protein
MHGSIPATLLVCLLAGGRSAAAGQQAPVDTLAAAVRIFLANDVEASLPLFTAAAQQRPGDPERHAWLAEAARRTERWSLAASEAYRALALNPCHAFAHEVLARLFTPQYSGWERLNADSAWSHALAAVRCDRRAGGAWMMVWIGALSRRDTALERRALGALVQEGFITAPYQTHGRWVLETAPPRAILIANGDLDTYPAVAAQLVAGVRPDVVVVNLALLNLRWYAELLRERHGLPIPAPAAADTAAAPGAAVLGHWTALAARGRLGRPLAILLTAPEPDVGHLAGPFWVVDSVAAKGFADRERIADALRRADALDWTGPAVSELDRSPVRHAFTRHPALWVVQLAAMDCGDRIRNGDVAGARQRLQWAERFLARARIPAKQADELLQPLRSRLARNPD